MPVTQRPAQVLPAHLVAEGCRVGQRAAATTSRGTDLDAADADLVGLVETELVQHPEDLDELVAEAVLERRALAVDPARHQEHLLVLDVDALDRADALGEVEDLGLGERRRGEPVPRSFSQMTGGLRHSSIVVQIENDGANS